MANIWDATDPCVDGPNIQPIKLCATGHVTPPLAQPGQIAVTNDGASAILFYISTPNLPGIFGAGVTARRRNSVESQRAL